METLVHNIEIASCKEIRTAPALPSLIVAGAASWASELMRVASDLALGFVHRPSLDSVASWLSSQNPAVVLVDLDEAGGLGQLSAIRKITQWAHIPLVGLSRDPTELVFAEAFWAGADDVVSPLDTRQLVARLRGARRAPPPKPAPARRRAIVAGLDPTFRATVGRALQGGGYEIVPARSFDAVVDGAIDGRTELVVTSCDLPGGPAIQALEAVRAAGCNVPFVISVASRFMARTRQLSRKATNVALCDAAAAPDELLVTANDLLLAPHAQRRAERRLSYGTRVWIRPAGGQRDVVAYTHNVSERGLFARSLFPFVPGDAAWIEVTPPRCSRRVRLLGQVIWHRPFGPIGPAGTGFRITEGLADELKIYEDGCRALANGCLV